MLREQIEAYRPFNEQEAFDKKAILAFIDRNPDYLLRSNLMAHFTVSTIVVNPAMDKVLFAHHNIYKSWGWLGGSFATPYEPPESLGLEVRLAPT